MGEHPEIDAAENATKASRIRRDQIPPAEELIRDLTRLGTRSEMAKAYGVHHSTVARWLRNYRIRADSHPEVRQANVMKELLSEEGDKIRIAQWIMDEGCVSVSYHTKLQTSSLIVMGSMNDVEALSAVADILQSRITSSKLPGLGTLPMQGIRLQGARGYALLQAVRHHLVGLKRMEADVALAVFPPTGTMKGKHTTDEFFLEVWNEFARKSLSSWNSRRQRRLSNLELEDLAQIWVTRRIARARRFSPTNSVPSAASSFVGQSIGSPARCTTAS
jgi:hypothetical protein